MKDKIKELRIKIDGLSKLVKDLRPLEQFKINVDSIPDGWDLETFIKLWREHGYTLGNGVEELPQQFKELEKSYDSLILAKAWLGKVLGELGQETPYKNDGKRKTVEDIEETADTSNRWVDYDTWLLHTTGKERTHIEKIDWLREEINELINETHPHRNDLINKISESADHSWSATYYMFNCNRHLSEARFWLGFELQRIKENEEK